MSNHARRPLRAALAAAAICGMLPAAYAAPLFQILNHEAVHIATNTSSSGIRHMRLEAFGRRFELDLQPNEGIRRAVPAGRGDIEPLAGTLEGQAGTWVRLTRTRAGWRGMIFDGRELYAVEPVADVADALVQPHADLSDTAPVMYRLADALMTVNPGFCETLIAEGTTGADAAAGSTNATSNAAPTRPTALRVFKAIAADLSSAAGQFPSKRLLTGVVADYEFANKFNDPEGAIIARMDIVDGIFSSQVGVKISLAPLTIIATPTEPFTKTAASELLSQLRSYRGHNSAQMALGVTHLMTGRNMDGDTVGIAYQGSLCNGDTSASLSEGAHSTTMSALIAAHELGHNFNAPHDGVPGACATTPKTFLMAPQINGSNQFSSCSLAQIATRIRSAQCLLSYAPPDVSVSVANNILGAALNMPFTVSFSVTASGDDPSENVTAGATLPASLSLQSATVSGGSCTPGAGTVSCSIGTLAPGETRQVDLQLTASVSGTLAISLTDAASNNSDTSNDLGTVTANISDVKVTPPTQASTAGGGGGGGRIDPALLSFLSLAWAATLLRARVQPSRR